MSFPKFDFGKAKRKRKREREERRAEIAMQVKVLDGHCMNLHCTEYYAVLEAHHITNRRPHAPELDCIENEISLCAVCHRQADGQDPAYDHEGNRLTARQFMLYILDQHPEDCRWIEQRDRLRNLEESC